MVIWEEPPPTTVGTPIKHPAWLEELRARPGQWALVEESVFSSQVTIWRRRYPDIEMTMREVTAKKTGKLYARHTPGIERETVECSVPSCDRPQASMGLCSMHYQRQRQARPLDGTSRRGRPRKLAPGMIGSPLGHARFGEVVYDDDGLLVCGECGKTWRQLATHVRGAHGMTATQYREKYGLGRRTPLVSAEVQQKLHEHTMSRIEDVRRDLDAHRDTRKATQASLQTVWAPETRAKRQKVAHSRRGADLSPEQRAQLAVHDTDLQAWADAARRLLDRGFTQSAIARASGLSPATISQRLRRYPPHGQAT